MGFYCCWTSIMTNPSSFGQVKAFPIIAPFAFSMVFRPHGMARHTRGSKQVSWFYIPSYFDINTSRYGKCDVPLKFVVLRQFDPML